MNAKQIKRNRLKQTDNNYDKSLSVLNILLAALIIAFLVQTLQISTKRIINYDKMCHCYSDLNFGVTFLEHSVDTD